jgi:hypothetical protein
LDESTEEWTTTDHDVEGDKATRLSESLADVVTFTEGETTTDGGTGRRSDGGVEGVCGKEGKWGKKGRKGRESRRTDVKGKVDRAVLADVLESHLDNLADTVLVDVVHREALDVCLSNFVSFSLLFFQSRRRKEDALFSLKIFLSPSSMSRRPM